MIIRLCEKENLTPILTVRKAEQAKLLEDEFKAKYVINTSEENWKESLGQLVKELKPTVAFECIAGAMPAAIMTMMAPGSTTILYGLLDNSPMEIPAGFMIGTAARLEGFYLTVYLGNLSKEEAIKFRESARTQLDSTFSSVISKRFGHHQIMEAIAEYRANMSAGKVLLQSALNE